MQGTQWTITYPRRLASSRGGWCRSKIYKDARTKLIWQRKLKHRWWALPQSIKVGTWCPKCAHVKTLTLGYVKYLAKRRGAKCLENIYINNNTKMLFECIEKKHNWRTTVIVLQRCRGCPICAATEGRYHPPRNKHY